MHFAATIAALALFGGDGKDGAARDVAFERDVLPLLRDTCLQCHGGDEPEAGLSFERFTDEKSAALEKGTWRLVRLKLRHQQMPPPDGPTADPEQVSAALRWLEMRLGSGEGAWPGDPGRVTIHRLNRAEYRNTVRDLLEVEFDAASKLPPDEVGYGFDNVGDVLSLSPLLLEKYVAAAEEIAARAFPADERGLARARRFDASALSCRLEHAHQGARLCLYENAAATADVVLPRDGDYRIRVRAFGQQAGPDPARLAFRVDGVQREAVDVSATEDAPQLIERRERLAQGPHRIGVAFLNDYYKPEDPDPKQRDRNLDVEWIEIEGPDDARATTAAEERFFACGVAHAHTRDCIGPIVERLATRAWRRPLEELELAGLASLAERELADGESVPFALQRVLAAALVAPGFLFRRELDPDPRDADHPHPLDDFELASRLSYFLWSSLPDERLFELARRGALHERSTLAEETRRLLRDPRASALVENFADQWLELRSLDRVSPDATLFPQFDEELRAAIRLETEMFFEAILREGRPVRELLDADFTFVNERLASLYGIPGVKGERMRRVRLADPRRGGVLTQASVLTLTSNPTRTSPVKRGRFVLERILDAPTPPPPPGVGVLNESDEAAKSASLKERLERHRKEPSCAVCHARMDPLGFSLEHFDPIGAWRERDGARAIDDGATLPDGRAFAGARGLRELVLADDAFERCLAQKLLVYALGRGPSDDDARATEQLVASFHGESPSFERLIAALVGLPAFLERRGDPATE